MSVRPLTERVLAGLPGPRVVWITVWALVPWLNAGANLLLDTGGTSAVWEQSPTFVVLNYTALSLAIVITVWGTGRIARHVEALRSSTAKVLEGDPAERFREMNVAIGPLVASAMTSVAFGVSALARDGWTSALLRGATWFVLGVAIWSFLWTYGVLHLGLDRLGRGRLLPEAARVDPALGLRPLGDVAFMGLWMLLAWLVPVLLTGLPDVVGVVLGASVLGLGLTAFVVSLVRLHRQMIAVKATELATARRLYAEAYEPVRSAGTLESLEQQRQLLGAADALESRARAIHEWPIDEGTVARVVTIATSVVAITIGRLILGPLGL